jgi:hypothetical protein
MWRRGRLEPNREAEGPVTARIVLARLDAVVDRLEGVYEQLIPTLDQAKTRPLRSPEGKR